MSENSAQKMTETNAEAPRPAYPKSDKRKTVSERIQELRDSTIPEDMLRFLHAKYLLTMPEDARKWLTQHAKHMDRWQLVCAIASRELLEGLIVADDIIDRSPPLSEAALTLEEIQAQFAQFRKQYEELLESKQFDQAMRKGLERNWEYIEAKLETLRFKVDDVSAAKLVDEFLEKAGRAYQTAPLPPFLQKPPFSKLIIGKNEPVQPARYAATYVPNHTSPPKKAKRVRKQKP